MDTPPAVGWLEKLIPAVWYGSLTVFVAITAAFSILLYLTRADSRKRVLRTQLIVLIALLVVNVSPPTESGQWVRQVAVVVLGLAMIRLWAMLLFRLLLPVMRIHPPRILEEILVVLGYIGWGLVLLRLAGLDLSHIVTTSAVITAVLAFAMQDTLGNILAGLSLQVDNSVDIGDWIKSGDLVGKVVEINWRATTLETRNWETVVIPNSMLMKNHFAILGKRHGCPLQWRRWIWFNINWDTLPTQIIGVVEKSLREAQLPGVAATPAPNCILMGFENGFTRYAVRYWLTDLAADDYTDSIVRTHIDAALRRHNLRMASPYYNVLTIKENEKYIEARMKRHLEERVLALRKVELLSALNDEEMVVLADQLKFTPFVTGDIIMHQGSVAHWLYIMLSGEVEVWLTLPDGGRKLVDVLKSGSFFGEMGLMTGESRSNTVIARSNVECLRLDKDAFQTILVSRKELAETISTILAQRLEEQRNRVPDALLDAEGEMPKRAELVDRVRSFFGLNKH
ncbi:mechanosensitive ion channel family protein [Chromobacterium violaceum]|uniref:mechanosensitive ion channel family protein n=1 Tax=Chromobacterium violaceum TaxID=536 RepID=UPI0009DA2C4E|nr:mechanosensitive ion channel family protein [Chromobacterium violaceum]QIY81452.1 mechanosensitive ion channel [Chromobacterium violaceum]QRO34082.1 mechanosensitive ion channel [Chromobacterium violaceum]QRQ16115.1 mechanosensitive ion channel [Chromobacterium violaceum]